MPIDPENIKKALDHFENDEYVDSKEILRKEIQKARDEYINKTVGIEDKEQEEIIPNEEDEEDE